MNPGQSCGFSQLAEADTPSLFARFIGAVAAIVQRGSRQPVSVNTWGDGLFMVFDCPAAGAGLAVQLRGDAMRDTDWPACCCSGCLS